MNFLLRGFLKNISQFKPLKRQSQKAVIKKRSNVVNNQYICYPFLFMKPICSFFFIVLLIVSCSGSSERSDTVETIDNEMVFGDSQHEFPSFSSLSSEQVKYWGVLNDIISDSRKINGSNILQIREYSENIRNHSDSLANSIPQTLDTQPIRSRLIVLNTRSKILFQEVRKEIIDSSKLQKAVLEFNTSIDNLILHINEKIQKDQIDMQRRDDEEQELKSQSKFRDSIFELERADQQRN